MKTIRTIIATLSAVLLTFALVAWFSVRRNAAFIQRTIYQGFDQTFVVALVMGCAFLLIAIILTVAIFSTENDEDDEEQIVRPTTRTRPPMTMERRSEEERRASLQRGEEPYRRVSRTRTMEQDRAGRTETDSGFARPRAEADRPIPRKRETPARRQDEEPLREDEAPVKKKAPRAQHKEELRTEAKPKAKLSESEAQPRFKAKLVKADPELTSKRKLSEPDPEDERKAAKPRPKPVAEPEEPEQAHGPEEEAEEARSEQVSAEDFEVSNEEGTVRCIFCGSVMSRDSQICPNCGKKR